MFYNDSYGGRRFRGGRGWDRSGAAGGGVSRGVKSRGSGVCRICYGRAAGGDGVHSFVQVTAFNDDRVAARCQHHFDDRLGTAAVIDVNELDARRLKVVPEGGCQRGCPRKLERDHAAAGCAARASAR